MRKLIAFALVPLFLLSGCVLVTEKIGEVAAQNGALWKAIPNTKGRSYARINFTVLGNRTSIQWANVIMGANANLSNDKNILVNGSFGPGQASQEYELEGRYQHFNRVEFFCGTEGGSGVVSKIVLYGTYWKRLNP